MRPVATRILALLLAVLPTVWGNCPCWFTDATCCGREPAAAAGEKAHKPCCPRCAKHEAPAPDRKTRTPDDKPGCGGCEGCPTLAARFATSLAPATVELPDDAPTWVAVAAEPARLDALLVACAVARPRVPWHGPSGPPASTETTVLRF